MIDEAKGTPRQYRGIIPKPESAYVTIAIESDGNIMSEVTTTN